MRYLDSGMRSCEEATAMTRREFLVRSAALVGTAAMLDAPVASAALHHQTIKFALQQINWIDDVEGLMRDAHDLGFPGVQLIAKWGNRKGEEPITSTPGVYKAMLAKYELFPVALTVGGAIDTADPSVRKAQLELHMRHAQVCQELGIMDLELVASHNKKIPPVADDYKRSGEIMTEIGRHVATLGVKTSVHNHMGSLCETPEQLDAIMAASDPEYLKLELDIAHCTAGGGNPATTIDQYHHRLIFIHAKDLLPGYTKTKWRFAELGQGIVDVKGSFAALERHRFKGWAVVEQDKEEVDPNRTPRQSAQISKDYINNMLKLKLA